MNSDVNMEERMEKSTEYIKARDKAIRYILYKSRTSYEVFNKLSELEFNEAIINQVIRDLIDLEYINDEEYVKKFIESKKKLKKLSKSMIKLKLKSKGIPNELIEKYIFDFSDIDAIKKVLDKKKFSLDMEYNEINKIKAYCMRKGFSMSDINSAIKSYNE